MGLSVGISFVLCLLGVFLLAAAAFDWTWALDRRWMGRAGSHTPVRVMYVVAGLFLLLYNGIRIMEALGM